MQAEATFALELAPGNSLLVTGEKEEQTNPSPYFGFSFDLRTKTKSPVRTKGVEWLWMWRFEKAAISPLPMSPMTFQFPDCTECEAERLLGSFYYIPGTGLGRCGNRTKRMVLLLSLEATSVRGDGPLWYDCLHAVSDLQVTVWTTSQCVARNRCNPTLKNQLKRVTSDRTVLYTAVAVRLARTVVGGDQRSHSRFRVRTARRSRKCKTPIYKLRHLRIILNCVMLTSG